MPMSKDFEERLGSILPKIVETFGTPFHIYDEAGIIETGTRLNYAFKGIEGFREFFAVKANSNTHILRIMKDLGFGFDCSSMPEIFWSKMVGAKEDDIMFTSNNTTQDQFECALSAGAIINLDDISLIDKLPKMPELICFRYNPGQERTGNSIIGNPVEAKYGVASFQIEDAYHEAMLIGANRLGLHTMVCSNALDYSYMVETVRMLLDVVRKVQDKHGVPFEFINMGGGLGIPYKPEEVGLPLETMAMEISALLDQFRKERNYVPKLFMESGRYITGPHGVLVTKVINHKNTYRKYVGVDACMSSLMRPGLYGAYHHIHVHGKKLDMGSEVVDVVGSLCENNDKFAIQRELPITKEGDIMVIHDTGAHGYSMGFNYNAQLRPAEFLLQKNGLVRQIRRKQMFEDLNRELFCGSAINFA